MNNYEDVSTKKILDGVQQGNKGLVLTGASATVSTLIIPIIVMLINKIGETDNTTLIIALSVICVTTIISTVIGVVIVNSNKGAVNALKNDIDNIEECINDHFYMDADKVKPKDDADLHAMSSKIPKKIIKQKKS